MIFTYRNTFICLIACFWNLACLAQAQQIDSNRELKDNAEKVKKLNIMSKTLQEKSPEKALIYAQQALMISERYNLRNGISDALYYIGNAYYTLENYTKSLEYYLKAVKFYKEFGNLTGEGNSYKTIGNIYYEFGDYSEALAYYLEALKIFEKTQDKAGLASSLGNIGLVNAASNNVEEALKNFQASLKIAEEIQDKKLIGISLNNIGSVYEKANNFQNALIYYEQALNLFKQIGNKDQLANTMNGLGDVNKKMRKTEESLRYYLDALQLFEQLNDHNGISYAYLGIGDLYLQSEKFDKAIIYFNKSLALAQKLQYKEMIRDNYQHLAEAYKRQNLFREALENHQKFKIYHDSIYNQSRLSLLAEMQIRFGFENQKKENDLQKQIIQNLNKEKTQQGLDIEAKNRNIRLRDIIIGLFIGILALIIALTFLLYRARIQSIRTNQKLTEQNLEINRQKTEIERKSEALNQALNKITDSIRYAESIQHSILPETQRIQQLFSENFVIFKPKEIVSGDFYWISQIQNQIFLAVADCTGHGISGGYMTMIGHTLLNEIINEKGISSPAEVLRLLNQGMVNVMQKQTEDIAMGMEIALCVLSENDQNIHITFAGAKRPMFLIEKEQLSTECPEIIEIKGDRESIGFGIQEERDFQNQTIQTTKGSLLYLSSDGYTDQANPQNKRIGTPQLKRLIQQIANSPLPIQQEKLENYLADFQQTATQRDDITIVGVKL